MDHANIFHSLLNSNLLRQRDNLGNKRIDYIKFKEILSKGCHLVGTIMFVGLLNKVSKEKRKFYNFLASNGFAIESNPVQKASTGELKQKGTDISIFDFANDLARIDSYDKAILVSGDGDFVRLVNKLKT